MAISLEHKSITVDVNNRNAPNVVAIANVNDKAVRYLDVTLTASGNKLTFTGCTATATFATDGYLISDSVACTINSAADVITVPLENFKSMSGFLAIEIKIANGETQVLNTPLALKVKVTPSLLDKSMISKDSAGTTAEICREVATARGKYESLNARLNGIDSAVSNKADQSTVSQLSGRMQTAEKALTGKANATDVANALKSKEDNLNKVSSKTDITDSNANYPSIEYLNEYYYDTNEIYSSAETDELLGNKADSNSVYSKVEADDLLGEKANKADVDTSLANKANLINSSNIFDFDAWAKGLQGFTNPVYRGTLGKVDYNEKSFAITTTEPRGYTNGWNSSAPQSMRIAVKPNTKYLFSCLPSSKNCEADVFLNGMTANHFELKGGFGSFTTAEDTTYILIRFVYYGVGFFDVSEIMIAEKESIYLPNEVAEGVPEVANEVLTFEKTTQTSLDGKYDSSNVEVGKGELTPAQATYDGCEGSFNYSKIGKTVTVALNITTLVAGKNYVQFAGLPFTAMTASKLSSIVAYTTANKLVNIRLHGSWLYISSPGTTFAEGDKINVIVTYIIG